MLLPRRSHDDDDSRYSSLSAVGVSVLSVLCPDDVSVDKISRYL